LDHQHPFALRDYHLDGVSLHPLAEEHAEHLARNISLMPPWSVIGYPARALYSFLVGYDPGCKRFEIVSQGEIAGTCAIRTPWLRGPYLQLMAILPDFQGRGFGGKILSWMEAQALRDDARQLWLCVSSFNEGAQAFYQRFGFEATAVLDDVLVNGSDEILMRKKLF
jgi:ribosomal protein S18 acetylase RimI-like enzyme